MDGICCLNWLFTLTLSCQGGQKDGEEGAPTGETGHSSKQSNLPGANDQSAARQTS